MDWGTGSPPRARAQVTPGEHRPHSRSPRIHACAPGSGRQGPTERARATGGAWTGASSGARQIGCLRLCLEDPLYLVGASPLFCATAGTPAFRPRFVGDAHRKRVRTHSTPRAPRGLFISTNCDVLRFEEDVGWMYKVHQVRLTHDRWRAAETTAWDLHAMYGGMLC